jgi:hypothetical protein
MDVPHVHQALFVILAKTDSNWMEIYVFQDVLVDSSSIIVNVLLVPVIVLNALQTLSASNVIQNST